MELKKVISRTRSWYSNEYEEHFTEKEYLSFIDYPLKYEWQACVTEETLKFDSYLDVAERMKQIDENKINPEKYTLFVETIIL